MLGRGVLAAASCLAWHRPVPLVSIPQHVSSFFVQPCNPVICQQKWHYLSRWRSTERTLDWLGRASLPGICTLLYPEHRREDQPRPAYVSRKQVPYSFALLPRLLKPPYLEPTEPTEDYTSLSSPGWTFYSSDEGRAWLVLHIWCMLQEILTFLFGGFPSESCWLQRFGTPCTIGLKVVLDAVLARLYDMYSFLRSQLLTLILFLPQTYSFDFSKLQVVYQETLPDS